MMTTEKIAEENMGSIDHTMRNIATENITTSTERWCTIDPNGIPNAVWRGVGCTSQNTTCIGTTTTTVTPTAIEADGW
jgi:hypothetical protein